MNLVLSWNRFRALAAGREKTILWIAVGTLIVFIVNIFLFSAISFFDFSLIDWGSFLDAAWRIWCGQRIYTDYSFHAGPAHLYMVVLFFKLFGVGKISILMHLATINTLTALTTFIVTWRRMPLIFSGLCTLLTLAGFYWIYPHPYYDYTAHFFGLLAVAALALTLPFKSPRQAAQVSFFCGFMAAIALMTKINVGAAYGLILGFSVLTGRPWFKSFSFYAAGSLTGLIILFATISSPANFLHNVSDYHAIVQDRLIRFLLILVYLKNFFWVPILMLPVVTRGYRKSWELVLCVGLGIIAIFTVNTGSFRGWDYLPMMGMYMALSFRILFRLLSEPLTKNRKLIAMGCIAILTLICLYQIGLLAGSIRFRIQLFRSADKHVLENGSFRGWVFPKDLGEIIDGMIAAVQQIPRNESLLILSDMQLIYPFSGKESYKGIPSHWYDGAQPPPPRVDEVRTHIYNHPPDWILTFRDGGLHPFNHIMAYLEIPPEYVISEYELVRTWDVHGLFRRRKAAQPAVNP